MNDLPRQKLCQLIAAYGESICDEPLRCEGLLRDLCGGYRPEINALIDALRERVAADLLSSSANLPMELVFSRLVRRLEEQQGMTLSRARWAVESWALALGKISNEELSRAGQGKVDGETPDSSSVGQLSQDSTLGFWSRNKSVIAFALLILVLAAGVSWYVIRINQNQVEDTRRLALEKERLQKEQRDQLERQPGKVVVNSIPSGASVWVDGAVQGKTPIVVDNVSAGIHPVKIELEGYQPAELMAAVKPGAAESLGTIQLVASAADVAGDAETLFRKAEALRIGGGMWSNPETAFALYQRAAGANHAGAQHRLGVMYAKGVGVAMNKEQAAAWYRKSADQGFAEAQHDLGVYYAMGEVVPRDDPTAVELYRKAAEQGLAEAQFDFGKRLIEGRGVAKDEVAGRELLRKAAAQGNQEAIDALKKRPQ